MVRCVPLEYDAGDDSRPHVEWRLARSAYVLRRLIGLPGRHAAAEFGIDTDRLYRLEDEYIRAARSSPPLRQEADDEFLEKFHSRLPVEALAERLGTTPEALRTRLDELGLEPAPSPDGSAASIRERIELRKAAGASLHEGVVRMEEPDLLEAARARFSSWREAIGRPEISPPPRPKPEKTPDVDRPPLVWILRKAGASDRDLARRDRRPPECPGWLGRAPARELGLPAVDPPRWTEGSSGGRGHRLFSGKDADPALPRSAADRRLCRFA